MSYDSEKEYTSLDSQYLSLKSEFNLPTYGSLGIPITNDDVAESTPVVYLAGNSLGLMPKQTRQYVNDEFDAWSERAVESHFRHPGVETRGKTSWVDIDLPLVPLLAPIIGSQENEVAVMGSLTSNLNALLVAFYSPKGRKTKILFEKNSFPSDYYSFLNHVKLKGYDEDHLIQLKPRFNEYYLRTDDILKSIEDHHEELALVLLPGIQYYTGQYFEIDRITKIAKKYNVLIGWDLAHAVGNVDLKLHDWGVDFATWCSYKYLNSGPGGISGIFIHSNHHDSGSDGFLPRLAGWWGNNPTKRFQMLEKFEPIQGALGFRQSNPSVIDVVSLKSSLDVFQKYGGIDKLRSKSIALTNYLENLLKSSKFYISPSESFDLDKSNTKRLFTILTPEDYKQRGAQLSLLFFPRTDETIKAEGIMESINHFLNQHGVICDERRPDVIRFAPVPLYVEFKDVYSAFEVLEEALESV